MHIIFLLTGTFMFIVHACMVENKEYRTIAENFRGVQFSQIGSLQSFRGIIFADTCDACPLYTVQSYCTWSVIIPYYR
jgi:hypothetical protein